jgi:hypothetical protein
MVIAHPIRALTRTILAFVAFVPGAFEGRMWMGIGLRTVTCLSDGAHRWERENRTESHNGDWFEHLRLRSSTWANNVQLRQRLRFQVSRLVHFPRPPMRLIVIEAETPGDSRTMFRVRIDKDVIDEGLTAAQTHNLVGQILDQISLPKAADKRTPWTPPGRK